MIHGDAKVRHLARNTKTKSGQPSRGVKLSCNRQHRHRTNHELRKIGRDTELWYGDTTTTSDTHDEGYIRDNRMCVHIQPIRRWAVATSHEVPIEQRQTFLCAQLPERITGLSAGYWFRLMEEFTWAPHDLSDDMGRAAWREQQAVEKHKLLRQARQILETSDLHSHLNRQLKQDHQTGVRDRYLGRSPFTGELKRSYRPNPGEPRVLYGLHDVSAFVADLLRGYHLEDQDKRPRGHHPEWLQTFKTLCDRNHI